MVRSSLGLSMTRFFAIAALLALACGAKTGTAADGGSTSLPPTRDCAEIARAVEGRPNRNIDQALCEQCQGKPCDAGNCANFPCVAGQRVLQLCAADIDCEGLGPFCGKYASAHDVCVLEDPH